MEKKWLNYFLYYINNLIKIHPIMLKGQVGMYEAQVESKLHDLLMAAIVPLGKNLDPDRMHEVNEKIQTLRQEGLDLMHDQINTSDVHSHMDAFNSLFKRKEHLLNKNFSEFTPKELSALKFFIEFTEESIKKEIMDLERSIGKFSKEEMLEQILSGNPEVMESLEAKATDIRQKLSFQLQLGKLERIKEELKNIFELVKDY